MVRPVVSPFDLSQTLPVGGGLLVLCSLPGPPAVKPSRQMVTMAAGRVGSFSQCASPNREMGPCDRSGPWNIDNSDRHPFPARPLVDLLCDLSCFFPQTLRGEL